MINYHKILEMHLQGISQRTISSNTGHSSDKIREVVNQAKAKGFEELSKEMNNPWLEDYLFPEKQANQRGYYDPDWDYIHKELLKKNVTLKLLHKEYEQEAEIQNKIPYAYRTFCEKYGHYGKKYKLTMPIHRKPGEILEVDWAGSTLSVKNGENGQDIKVYIFVATWPFSQYSYVEGFYDMKTDNWLAAHIHALEFFQGVPETVVSDNLRTGVTKTDYSEPLLNEGYRQLSDYYRFTIVTARVRAPKDKCSVEENVGFISRQVIAALRNETFFSLKELNQAISEKTQELNQEAFQKRPGSRFTVFQEEELPSLGSLRHPRFTQSQWRISKVQLDYHIQVERMFYSVPYEYVNDEVEVRITDHLIEVYFNEHRIASHKRLRGDIDQYSSNIDHMPDNHRRYIKYGCKQTTVRLSHGPNMPTLLRLRKQRYFCKHCEQNFTAETSLIQKYCCISNLSRAQIAQKLTETQSMKLIPKRYNVSISTVIRVLRKSATALTPNGRYLPKHVGLDEFKSVKDVSGKMSAVLVDTHNNRLIDIIEDRKQGSLIDYFARYTKGARDSVETISIDMYTPYLDIIQTCFPHAKIVIDRFHIVQLLNNTINSVRVKEMNKLHQGQPRDYRKLKNQWRLLLKKSEKLNFSTFFSHRLYDGLVSEKMMVDYLVNLSPALQITYDLMNTLKYAIETHDFILLEETIASTKRVTLPKRTRRTIQTLQRFLPYIKNSLT